MYGYYGAGYDLASAYNLNGDDMGDLDGIMDTVQSALQTKVAGVPVWGLLLGGAALMYTRPGKRLLGAVGLGGKASKKNPRRRKNRRKSRRSRR
jgi:hypothetical protein